MPSPDDIRHLVLEVLAAELAMLRLDPADVGDAVDLRAAGLVDSLGFVEVLTAVEERFGLEIDLEALPPEQLTVLGPLCRSIALQAGAMELRT